MRHVTWHEIKRNRTVVAGRLHARRRAQAPAHSSCAGSEQLSLRSRQAPGQLQSRLYKQTNDAGMRAGKHAAGTYLPNVRLGR